MLWKHFILCLLLYIMAMLYEVFAENVYNFEDDIINRVKITAKYNNVNQVKFNNVSCTIHYYNLTVKSGADEIRSKSMQFYFCISCMFADWIRNVLFETIDLIPLFYNSKLISSNSDVFRNTISVSTLASIANNNERFIDILFNIINMYTYAAHIDTDLLKSLLLFHFKINFITKLYDHNNDVGTSSSEIIEKDDVIIPLILDSINDIQRFSALNCDVSSAHQDNNRFYGYSLNKPGTNRLDIEHFFNEIKPMSRESSDRCTVERILLRNVLYSDDLMALEISKTILFVESERVILKDILTEIGDTYNLELVLWYLRIVHESITKIVFTQVLGVLKSQQVFDYTTIDRLSTLRFLFSELMNLPQPLVDVFDSLILPPKELQSLGISVGDVMKSIIKRYLDKRRNPSSDAEDVYDAFRLPFFHVDVIPNESKWMKLLDDLLNAIVKKTVDYRCMANALAFLNVEKGKYYVPHVQRSFTVYEFLKSRLHRLVERAANEPKPKIDRDLMPSTWCSENRCSTSDESVDQWRPESLARERIADDVSLAAETCNYLTTVYQHCVQAIAAASDARCISGRGSSCAVELVDHVSAITLHLNLNLFDTAHWSAALSQIAFDVVPMRSMVADHVFRDAATGSDVTPATELLTYMHVVMTALNGYAVGRCQPPRYRYLLFNNIDFDAATTSTGNHDCSGQRDAFLNALGARPVQKRNGYDDDKAVRSNTVLLTALNKLYVSHIGVDVAEHQRLWENLAGSGAATAGVRFYWRGEPMTLAAIAVNVRTTVMNPTYMYALVDVYYKYVLAAVYMEIYAYVNQLRTLGKRLPKSSTASSCELYHCLGSQVLLSTQDFPKPYKYLLELINQFVALFFRHVVIVGTYPMFYAVELSMEKEIARLGIIVHVKQPQVEPPVVKNEMSGIEFEVETVRCNAFQKKVQQIIDSTKHINEDFIRQFLDQYK